MIEFKYPIGAGSSVVSQEILPGAHEKEKPVNTKFGAVCFLKTSSGLNHVIPFGPPKRGRHSLIGELQIV